MTSAARRWVARRASENDNETHRCIGRSSANFRGFFKKMPTETGSTWTGPTVLR
jgi:hypothetical protein